MINEYTLSLKEVLFKKFRKHVLRESTWVEFIGNFDTRHEALLACQGGYEDNKIFDKVSKAALTVKSGKANYERDGYLFYKEEIDLQLVEAFFEIYLNDKRFDIVDYGGSLGSAYFQNLKKLNFLGTYTWNVIEQKHFVDFGKDNLENEHLKFYYQLNDVRHTKYNCVLFGASLQYIENYREILAEIASNRINYIIVDRLTVCDEDRYCVQRVYEPIYDAVYPVHVFSEEQFCELLTTLGYTLEHSWIKNERGYYVVGNKIIREKSFFWVRNI